MTIFELVKQTLDELYSEGVEEHGKKLDAVIRERMTYLTDSYTQLGDDGGAAIKYRDPATRFAYVYKYVTAHADYIVQSLAAARLDTGSNLFPDSALRLTCIGGGPGSDIVGVLTYLNKYPVEPVDKITCYLLDAEQAWADTWTEVADSLNSSATINVNFQKLDVRDPASWSAQKKFLKANLFTLSYFVSEVYKLDNGQVSNFWTKLFDEAPSGALFLYVDNGSDVFNAYFDDHWKSQSDIEQISGFTNQYRVPSSSEDKAELGAYLTKFGNMPKLSSRLSVRVLRKL